jgi:DDE superfamily endonuclease
MQLPIVAPAPVVAEHTEVFRDLFENRCQFDHFQHYLTALMVLDNKSLSNTARCVLDSADKTNLSRFFSEAPWRAEEVNERRLTYLLEQTAAQRRPASASYLLIDDTLAEHVGSLFEYIARHYNHAEGTYPLAHNPLTTHYVSGPVRFPVDLRLYRRYEELTRWEEFVHKHFPHQPIPKHKEGRKQLRKQVEATLLADAEFHRLHEQFRTKIELAIELVECAIKRELPFGVVLFDGWYLAHELIAVIEKHHKDWISVLKSNRNLETNSFVLFDAEGKRIELEGPHIQVQKIIPLIPASAYREVKVGSGSGSGEHTYWCFTLNVRLSELGKVRVLVSFDNGQLKGDAIVLVTNRVEWDAKRIIATYLQRWPIETFYQDSKGVLGFSEYRMRGAEAIGKHWCLVFLSYSLLHLTCLPLPLAKASAPSALPVKTIGEAAREQGRALIEALLHWVHQRLELGYTTHDVFNQLFAKQGVAALT